jgi:hypothetical protein
LRWRRSAEIAGRAETSLWRLETTGPGDAMTEYRAYMIGDDGHFIGDRLFTCDSDADAIEWAKQLVDGHDVQLWSGPRFVVKLEKKN